ncbi:hypothetical protein V1506DRAFT_543818 [Lipomyces tetrasporus]
MFHKYIFFAQLVIIHSVVQVAKIAWPPKQGRVADPHAHFCVHVLQARVMLAARTRRLRLRLLLRVLLPVLLLLLLLLLLPQLRGCRCCCTGGRRSGY